MNSSGDLIINDSAQDVLTTPDEFGTLNGSRLCRDYALSKSGGIVAVTPGTAGGGGNVTRGDTLSPLKSHLSESYTKYEIISSRHASYDRYQQFVPDVVYVHSLNLDDRQQRLIVFSIILFLWCFPTIALSLDFYFDDDHQQHSISSYSATDNLIHLLAMTIILSSCLFLLFFEMVRVRHFIISNFCGLLLIAGGCVHLIGTILYSNSRCSDRINSKFIVNDHSAYCHIGYIGGSSLGVMVPVIVGIDTLCSALNQKHCRIIVIALILWITSLMMIIVLCKYGNGFGSNISNHSVAMSHGLFTLITLGWWLLFWATSFVILEIVVAIYVLRISKFQFEFIKYRAVNILLGFALIVSVSLILVEKDGCVSGKEESGDLFCQFRKTYVLIGLACILGYEMQTLY